MLRNPLLTAFHALGGLLLGLLVGIIFFSGESAYCDKTKEVTLRDAFPRISVCVCDAC
jgi:hypothetical protein